MKLALLACVVALAACATPAEPAEQAEAIGSIAAEGGLLARDAADGDTTGTFTRVHAEALREKLGQLAPAVDDAALVRLLGETDGALAALAKGGRPAPLERRLEAIARRAEERAG